MESLSVLIIEDEILVAEDLRRTMEKAGHTVPACARSFNDALSAAVTYMPDIVILDIHLAGSRDGIATAQEILAHRQVPIVVLTGSTENETYIRARRNFTPAAYLTKPFRAPDLVRMVELAWQNFSMQPKESEGPSQNHIFLPVEKGFEKIVKAEVAYIATRKSTHSIHLFEVYKKTPRTVQLSIAEIEHYFSPPVFYRLSRSLIVNLHLVDRIEGSCLWLQDITTPLVVPESAKADLMRKLTIGKRSRK
ncbi:hypothetical protein GCM10023091_21550 [Ravibacter arvi]|uniref:Response regulatory domain-containing protein n=1 Tax=Ravibacter arvi TaxID=2051041 RepID=A0ABP8LZ70_9BACT